MSLTPSRVVAELRELQELTGDENGAQRVAWTETWETARAWLRDKVAPTGAVDEIDEAGNQWFTLSGEADRKLLLGGHIDDRLCVLGTVEQAKAKLRDLEAVGVDQFNIYLMTHGQEQTLQAFGDEIIPELSGARV